MNKKNLLTILTCIFLPLFILLSSYQISLKFIEKTIVQEQTINLIREERSEQLLAAPLNYNYTAQEISHLKDVEKVMTWADSLWLFSVIALLMAIAFCIQYSLLCLGPYLFWVLSYALLSASYKGLSIQKKF